MAVESFKTISVWRKTTSNVHTTNLELKAKNENYFVISCYINIIVQPTSSGIGTQKLGFRDYLPDVYNWGKWNYLYTCIPGLFKNLI